MEINAKKPYLCIDCGTPVGRRIKRCPKCHQKALINRPPYERTPEYKQRMSELQKQIPKAKGWKHKPETRLKIASTWDDEKREAARERGKELVQNPDYMQKLIDASAGENNPNWKGGISGQKYAPGFTKTLKQQIRARDAYTCQLCGKTESELGYTLSIHHADYDKSNHDKSNLFSTCKRCNSLVNTNRDYWITHFLLLVERRQLGQDISYFLKRKVITQQEGFVFISYD